MYDITLHGQWLIKAPLVEVFNTITDFEKWPDYFPQVARSVKIKARQGNNLEIEVLVKSFGRLYPVTMKTKVLPKKGFISDNVSPKFGTSGHEKLLLSESAKGTTLDYTYEVSIHKKWLRFFAKPIIGYFSMKFWKKAVIDELRKRLES